MKYSNNIMKYSKELDTELLIRYYRAFDIIPSRVSRSRSRTLTKLARKDFLSTLIISSVPLTLFFYNILYFIAFLFGFLVSGFIVFRKEIFVKKYTSISTRPCLARDLLNAVAVIVSYKSE